MLSHLYKLYENQIVSDPSQVRDPNRYLWFYTDRRELFGLPDSLSKEERGLLHAFLQRVTLEELSYTTREAAWHQLLIEDQRNVISFPEDENYHFIFFSLSRATENTGDFTETLRNYGCVLWLGEQEGVLIAEQTTESYHEQQSHVLSTLRALEEDLSVDVQMYISRQYKDFSNAKNLFTLEHRRFLRLIELFHGRRLFYPSDAPLVDLTIERSYDELIEWQQTQLANTDRELRRTVFIYLQSQMNVTQASKHLHMHRNTLQYRLDKFQDHAGPVFQDFSSTVAVYIALWLSGEHISFVHNDEGNL